MLHDDTIREEAMAWAVRTGDPAFDDWDGFTQWLEADPAHAAAYDAISVAIEDGAEAEAARVLADNDDDETDEPRISRRWFGGALAASLAALAAFSFWPAGGGPVTYTTAPGETRLIALENGDSIELAGGSTLVLGEEGARFARLDEGQALFTLDHEAGDPFTVAIGEDRLVDIGTVFDVRAGNGTLSVSVSEGAIVFNPGSQSVRVDPGQVLTSTVGSSAFTMRDVPSAQVGEWREGRLTFREASLEEVATDLTRATGVAFTAAPGGESRAISGSILVTPIAEDPGSVGALLGIGVRQSASGWVLDAK